MLFETLKRILALGAAMLVSGYAVVWGYDAIDSQQQIGTLERLTPLLVASVFVCALAMTVVRYVSTRIADDLGE